MRLLRLFWASLLLLLCALSCVSMVRFFRGYNNYASIEEVQIARDIYETACGSKEFYPCNRSEPNFPVCGSWESQLYDGYCVPSTCESGHVINLSLHCPQLTEFPPEINQLTGLERLSVSSSQSVNLPPEIWRLSELLSLNLNISQLTSLPPGISHLQNLERLVLANNQLEEIPPEIGQLENLRYLDLSGNQLTGLPPEVGQLRNLEHLDVSGNQLASLPPDIRQLEKLRYLNLRGNPLAGPLPTFLTNFNLSHFYFHSTDLCVPNDEKIQIWLMDIDDVSQLPPEIACSLVADEQEVLFTLYQKMGDHPINWSLDTPPCTWSGIRCDWTGHVISIDIGRYLPAELPHDFSGYSLTELPPGIGEFTHLRELILFRTGLTQISPQVGQLRRLERLELSGNQLTGLPSEIGRLARLGNLDLSNNQLTNLPPEVGQLSNLRYLDLSDNYLTGLPTEIGELRNLEHLVLSNNQLSQLPPEIGDLSNLKILTVRDNPLSGPIPMFLINSLQPLSFDFTNTGLCVPDEEKVLDWFKRAYENGKHYVYVVGEGLVEEDSSVLVQNLLEYAGCEEE